MKKPTLRKGNSLLDRVINSKNAVDIYQSTNQQILDILFPDTNLEPNASGEVQVISPLPRSYTSDGKPIYEHQPSASINIEKGLFYDFANVEQGQANPEGMTLIELFRQVQGLDRNSDANKLLENAITHVIDPKVVEKNRQTYLNNPQ
ncbi:hypothetical protein Zmor_016320 [Zophobas morio]|uniref:Uncharacterized protein n=1 Tax=Zophobas morio TaxID=2755281 RepID=A0AA38HHR3_9CUCU|nr:hypothetical protein Zmor_016320 [Zophobas morio]